jgi:hypothetical protein
VTGTTLKLSEPVTFEAGETHYIIVSDQEGKATGPYTATAGEDAYHVIIDTELTFTPQLDGKIEPPFYQFGTSKTRSIPALIQAVKPNGRSSVSVTAHNNDARVYDDDDHGLS